MNYEIITPTGYRQINISWPSEAKQVAVAVSGGVDSALLLWMMSMLEPPSGSSMVAVCMQRGERTTQFASEIVNRINRLCDKNTKLVPIQCDPGIPHTKIGYNIKNMMGPDTFQHVMSASTENPPVDLPGLAPIRVPLSVRQQNANIWTFPFMHCDKTHTVALIKKHLLDWIFDVANTCTEKEDKRCSACWQCRERAWAFSQLNLVDPGKY